MVSSRLPKKTSHLLSQRSRMKKLKTAKARLLIVLAICLVLSGAGSAQSNSGANTPVPPMTEKKTKTTKIHDDTMLDDYFWLRDKSRSEEHTSELQSRENLVCRLLLEKK